jgi:hypothetical protein
MEQIDTSGALIVPEGDGAFMQQGVPPETGLEGQAPAATPEGSGGNG